ncbi:MAG TPA: hypothetical protein VFL85_01105 [Candidatus Saccharimonadales bacterium]|nr:hypothetical protein [Candidatus Saccharimonadales bacterium]
MSSGLHEQGPLGPEMIDWGILGQTAVEPFADTVAVRPESLEPAIEEQKFQEYLQRESRTAQTNALTEKNSDELFNLTALMRQGLKDYAKEQEAARLARLERADEVYGEYVERYTHQQTVVEPNRHRAEMAVKATEDNLQLAQVERMRTEKGQGRIPEFEAQKLLATGHKDAAIAEQRTRKSHFEQERDNQVATQETEHNGQQEQKHAFETSKAGWQRRAKELLTGMAPVNSQEDIERLKKEIDRLGMTQPIAGSTIELQPGQTFESLLDAANKDRYAMDTGVRVCLIAVGEHIKAIEIPQHDTRIRECEDAMDTCAAKIEEINHEYAPLIAECDDAIRSILELYEHTIQALDRKISQERERLITEKAWLIGEEAALDRKRGEDHQAFIAADLERRKGEQQIGLLRTELAGIRDESENPRNIVPSLQEALKWNSRSNWQPGQIVPQLPHGDSGEDAPSLGRVRGGAVELEEAIRPRTDEVRQPTPQKDLNEQTQGISLVDKVRLGVRLLGVTKQK